MSERDKMLAGEPYDPFDAEIGEMALRARQRVAAYCAADAAQRDERTRLLREVFALVGRGSHVEPPFFADFGVHTTIGEETFINVNAIILDNAPITIGNRCLFGPAVQLITVMHPLRAMDRRTPDAEIAAGKCPARTMTAPVTIGDDVWLGAGVIVLPGVTVGDRCTIGAGSVVTTDIPPDSLALGTPAKVVRTLAP